MKQKIQRFMYGRYGFDQFSRFLMAVAGILLILDIFINNIFINSWLIVTVVYVYFRMFSRNTAKRYAENQKYLQIKAKVMKRFQAEKWTMKQRKTHHIYKCPTCRQKIRIPRGKGRICITCPKCKTEFTKTS